MTKQRFTILMFLAFCSAVSLVWGFVMQSNARGRIADFKLAYYDAQCLLHGCDPYSDGELVTIYTAEGGTGAEDPTQRSEIVRKMPMQVYLPAAFLCIAPFAALTWGQAHLAWMLLTAGLFTLGVFLIWDLAERDAPDLVFYLACIELANCGVLFAGGNPAGIVISLCTIATWCFVRHRFETVGVICLAISLAIKPHDAGLVWLSFLLTGGVLRRRAWQSLAVVAALTLPAMLWVSHVAPGWMHELHSNLAITAGPGGNADPGLSSGLAISPGMIIDLQTVISIFCDNSAIYNPISYGICGILLAAWMVLVLRSKATGPTLWYALAVIAPLTQLPFYHRPYDAKLLILTIPACAMLWKAGGKAKWLAIAVTAGGILMTSDIPLAVLALVTAHLNPSIADLPEKLLAMLMARPIPLILLGGKRLLSLGIPPPKLG